MRTIVANLTVESLNNLIKELEEYKNNFQKEVDFILKKLCKVCERIFLEEYTAGTADANDFRKAHTTKRKADGTEDFHEVEMPDIRTEEYHDGDTFGYVITAEGKDVCFLEFGTGMYAGFGSEDTDGLSFEVYPGSWSETHEHTYEHWLKKKGKSPYDYPFTIYPRNAFAKAYAEIKINAYHLVRSRLGGHS